MNKKTEDTLFERLHTLRDWVRWGASQFNAHELFFGHGTDNALDEALALVLHALHLDHQLPESFLDARLDDREKQRVLNLFQQRWETRKPAAYLTHHAYFAGLSFYVNESVLVPRSPIAEWIQKGFEPWLQAEGKDELRILDLCTGSACIAIACAYRFPHARIDAADISPAALDVARINVAQHGLEERLCLYQSDLFGQLPVTHYDLIVSNPPYVDAQEMATLPEEYRHEPELGLAGGEDGMELVAQILRDAANYLSTDGILVVEVGESKNRLLSRYPDVPFIWLDLEQGGNGVFLLDADTLAHYRSRFEEECPS